ncbi:MAG: virulence RhuM family protein [Desulfobacula sp.]|uniref:virulence RhuM family protein n=1 Tax=Desulfobacula sp. TaxID=2593537 RepID=UPI0025BA8B68|nr:virulence RhuM family protein [Desulfobacula sp.]MCD4720518.1 virulence RhuM family protein [Desulfobacula sp.]
MKNKSDILIYQSLNGDVKIDVRLQDETVWLTQKLMAELFQVAKSTISEHVKNIYNEKELMLESTVRKFRTVQKEGTREVKRHLDYYNLDMVLSVGYRVKSSVATKFRIWATQRLKEYIVKGFTLNDDRFKSGSSMNYFTELQDRIREIRLSERFFYQKIKDIYTTSIDYDSRDEKTTLFFKVVQNKLLWAISQQTAAELVYRRVGASLPLMGMQSFDKKGAVSVTKRDVSIAKNYLNEDEIKLLGLLVEQYLAFAETMAQLQTPMYMKDWTNRLDAIIQLNGKELLTHAGKISHAMAAEKSVLEYEKYRQNLRKSQYEQNLKELEKDIKRLEDKS